MGQSFLSHDEKSSGTPSPDLLRFSAGGGQSNPKFFGSLSSVKEASTSGSCRSQCESTDSEKSLLATASASYSPPRSPILLPEGSKDGNRAEVDDAPSKSLYESLVPTPIIPGNVSRLRKKFMEFERSRSVGNERDDRIDNNSFRRKEVSSELECHYNSGENASSSTTNTIERRIRGATLPPSLSSPRCRNSLHTLSPSSYQNRRYRTLNRISRTLPSTPTPFSPRSVCNKSDGIRSANDLSEHFRQMTLHHGQPSTCTVDNFSNENTVGRQRIRTRPNVPPPRSFMIKAGYLPTVQKVNRISNRGEGWASVSPNFKLREEIQDGAMASMPNKSHSECRTSISIPGERDLVNIEDRKFRSSSSVPLVPNSLEEPEDRVVTKLEDHTEEVLKKDAAVNTSAEVLVLPEGTKTSVVLKSGLIIDEVDGNVSRKARRKKKRDIRRFARAFGRVMIRFLELF